MASEVSTALGLSSVAFMLEVVRCLTYADVAGKRTTSPFDVVVRCEVPYDQAVSVLEASQRSGAIANWMAFEVLEQRTFERRLGDRRSQVRWKKLAIIRRRPGVDAVDFRRRYARHLIECRDHALYCWKYRQSDVGRSSGLVDSEVDGISEFWRNSEELLQLNQYPEVVADTDSFVDHRVGVDWPIILFGVEEMVHL